VQRVQGEECLGNTLLRPFARRKIRAQGRDPALPITHPESAIMRIVVAIVAIGLVLVESGGMAAKPAGKTDNASPATTSTKATTKARVDFDTQLKPIFKSKCMPCHFSGGQMYDRLPFDRPETIRKLGTKLFTRIKEAEDRQLIDDFLTQTP